jgi:manganese/zinc/iron transport system permease protein
VFGIVSLVLILLVSLFYKELKLLAFDESFAKSIGLPVRALNILLTTLTVLAVVTGIQAVGVVLMAAMLITPPAAARFWTHNVFKLTLIAAIMGGLSGLAGAFVSYTAPTMPTGPWIVVVISGMAIVSFLFAPQRGIISRWRQKKHMIQNLMDENLLKEFYHLEEQNNFAESQSYSLEDILSERFFPKNQLYRSLRRLKHKDYLLQIGDQWSPTSEGRQKGKRLVKLHRLWELYLSNEMNIAPDHVHDDAETIEHVITPEIEAELEHLLSYPEKDPHNKEIPYS